MALLHCFPYRLDLMILFNLVMVGFAGFIVGIDDARVVLTQLNLFKVIPTGFSLVKSFRVYRLLGKV